jgi:MFS family permease
VLIREITRHTGRGWPTILLLGAAFGLIQAGLIDQSLFNPGYLDNDDPTWAQAWRQERQATLIPGLGISASHLGFVAGYMIMTVAAPIAVVEAFVPDRADRPWLGRNGLTVIGLLYLLGAGFVFAYDTRPRGFLIAPAQLISTAEPAGHNPVSPPQRAQTSGRREGLAGQESKR